VFGRTSKRTATPNEAAVVSAILHSSGDPRADRLLRQFTTPKRVLRQVSGPRLLVSLDVVTTDLRVDLDEDLRSAPVRVFDEGSGTALTFTVRLAQGGFLQELAGEAEGASWPELWSVHPTELTTAAVGSLRLPAQQPVPVEDVARAVGAWDLVGAESITTRVPATQVALDELEAAQEAALPPGVPELLLVSDGLVVPPVSVSGVADLYLADVPELGHLWSLGLTGATGVFVWDDDKGVLRSSTPAEPGSWVLVAPTYEDWVRGLLSGR
jgi:hypothetical protein